MEPRDTTDTDTGADTTTTDPTWDCIVVGGGAAGLSAALVLGRARRTTLVIDAGGQSNAVAHGIGGLLGHDGRPPGELYSMGRDELAKYPTVEVRTGEVASGERRDGSFELTLGDGTVETARRVLLATGMDYRMADLPGVAERWGRSVFHCPFCHGWEVRDLPIGVLAGDTIGALRTLMLKMWSDDVTLYTNGANELTTEDTERLEAAGVTIDDRSVSGLEGPGDALAAVTFADGSSRRCEGLMLPVRLHQRGGLAAMLGAEAAPPTMISADSLVVDAMAGTSVPGLFAAGDLGAAMPSVANAVAAGSNAAAAIVHSLMAERFGVTM